MLTEVADKIQCLPYITLFKFQHNYLLIWPTFSIALYEGSERQNSKNARNRIMGTSFYRSLLLRTGGFSVSEYIQRFAKREELEEPNAKLKTGVHNRGIQAEIKRFPEAVEKTLPDESISSDDILHLQSLNQVEEKQKNANLSGEKPTKSKNLDLKKDTASPLATAEHDHKPSRKTKEVTIKSREPTRSQTFDNDTYDISVTSSNCDASSSNKEETKNASLSVTSVHSEPLFSETNHQSKQATISSLESSSDTGRKTSSVLDEEHTTETIPVTQSNQVNLKASKMYAESIKTILEKQTERRTSLKPEGTSSKRKDSSIKKESSTPLTKSSCLSKPKNEQKPVAQDSKMSGMQQKDGNLLKQLSLEKSINEPHKEQDNQMKDSDPGGHEKEAGENSDAVRNCEEQPKAELLEAKSCTETTQKASLIVIDDSPPLPAPFEHRIVSAKQMPVTTCYSVSQHEVLGGGRFGQVHKCAEVSSGLVLAAKIIKVKCSKDREEVKNEIGVMNQLNHVNLIQLYDAYESKNSLTLIMEYVDGGELFDRIIDENYHLTELDAIVFARQICEGVQYLHQQYILHLDLKPENILCVNNTGNQIKIIDFGLARRYKPREKLKVNFGTPEFLAPEVVNYDFVSFATDMWSVGVITYMLLSGLSPFLGDNDTETMNSILHGNWDFDAEAFENISAEAKDFISRLLVPEKSNRMSAAGCLKHDWLNNLADKAKRCQVRLKSQLLLQSYLAHRQWKKHFYAVAAANRLRKFHQRRTMNLV
ncbi:myosin light chain kinase 3 isoform X2 [Erpetoichthys calabaricus]|nr:myosin light chain kinase 3 isoform X2 [Erpetoichthys calabaricus]